MKWVLASVGLLVVIVVFSLAALDQKDVVWSGGKPHCPHCRVVVEQFSEVCSNCQRAYDWQSYERPCRACISELDALFLQRIYKERPDEVRTALAEEGASEEAIAGLAKYLTTIKKGACGYCGGTGEWLAPGFKDGVAPADARMTKFLMEFTEGACPVCYDEKTCRLCEGEGEVECGREDPFRSLEILKTQVSSLNTPADPASALERFRDIQSFFRRVERQEEILSVPSFDVAGGHHMDRAIRRVAYLKKLLNRLAE